MRRELFTMHFDRHRYVCGTDALWVATAATATTASHSKSIDLLMHSVLEYGYTFGSSHGTLVSTFGNRRFTSSSRIEYPPGTITQYSRIL